jgi:hypothetical protein
VTNSVCQGEGGCTGNETHDTATKSILLCHRGRERPAKNYQRKLRAAPPAGRVLSFLFRVQSLPRPLASSTFLPVPLPPPCPPSLPPPPRSPLPSSSPPPATAPPSLLLPPRLVGSSSRDRRRAKKGGAGGGKDPRPPLLCPYLQPFILHCPLLSPPSIPPSLPPSLPPFTR